MTQNFSGKNSNLLVYCASRSLNAFQLLKKKKIWSIIICFSLPFTVEIAKH